MNAQATERQTPKGKPAYTPISLDHEELPDDGAEASWSAQEAQSPTEQDATQPAREDAQAMSLNMSQETGQEGGR
ncbi:MAG: hypothetical protein II132_04170, partial [Desulfovibrio sp.]|nr:hypothetical protein [Desulfovibrio sp.]